MYRAITTSAMERSSLVSLWRYQPVVPIAASLCVGIAADRVWSPSLTWTVGGSLVALLAWSLIAAWTRRHGARGEWTGWSSSLLLLLVVANVGAIRHHVHWNVYSATDIGRWARREPHPIVVRGVLTEEPLVVEAGSSNPLRAQPEQTRSIATIEVEGLRDSDEWLTVTGQAKLLVDGALTGPIAGDRIEVLGELAAPSAPSNPGEFDYRAYLRGRRIRAIVRCDETQGVQVLAQAGGPLDHPFQRLAGWAERVLSSRLPRGQREIAVALLLGRYELLEEDVIERFMQTGTMHILAISGQHLAILAGFLWLLLRFLPVDRKWGAVLLVVVVAVYALVTGARPPVLRAAILVGILVGSIVVEARSRRANALSLALCVVIMFNPSDLFDRGLQLSFLAVAALGWIVDPAWRWLRGEPDPIEELVATVRPTWQRVAIYGGRVIAFAFVMSLVVWLANVPLLAARFHLVSPIVVPLTVLLTPLATVALIAGLLLLIAEPLMPFVAELLAHICGGCVWLMDWCVAWGAKVPGGYWYVPGPPGWWVAGFYLGLAAVLMFRPSASARWRWGTAGAVWVILGLALPVLRPPLGRLECRVLAVGNGAAIAVHLPDDGVVLFDAGQISGPRVGSRLIAPALWHAGATHINAIFISHADVDHFNGVPHLLERFRVDRVFVPPHFAKSEHAGVRVLLDALERHRVPVTVCWAGHSYELSPGVVARVLHPPASFAGSDNEHSLAILLDYRSRRILLPGDIEGAGLRRLLATDPINVDVLVAPHHGSRKANPPQIIEWCNPDCVVVSQGKPRSGATLDIYREAGVPVVTTNEHGAITIVVDAAGMRYRTTR